MSKYPMWFRIIFGLVLGVAVVVTCTLAVFAIASSLGIVAGQEEIALNGIPTAAPTLTISQKQELITSIEELMQNDDDCQLPCFWDFIPGDTKLDEAQNFWLNLVGRNLETTLSEDGRIYTSYWVNFIPNNPYTDLSVSMIFIDDTLNRVKISISNTPNWQEKDWLSLQNILLEFQDDNEFYIGINRGGVTIILLNAEANFLLQKTYQLRSSDNIISPSSPEPLLLCPFQDYLLRTSLWILDDEYTLSIEEIIGNPIIIGNKRPHYESLKFMTRLSSNEFSEIVQRSPQECIEMRPYGELLELGYGF